MWPSRISQSELGVHNVSLGDRSKDYGQDWKFDTSEDYSITLHKYARTYLFPC